MTRHPARVAAVLFLLVATCPAQGTWAGEPTDHLRDGVERVVKILRDPGLKGDQQLIRRRQAVSRVASEIFDFGEMAKRSLAQHWEPRTPAERVEFVRLFTDLVERTYIGKVDQHDAAAKTTFRGETIDGEQALVKTTIGLSNGSEMPLDYRMHSTDTGWQVYDVNIEGISLVANYRGQFNKIIRTSSYESLVTRLKAQQGDDLSPNAPRGAKATR